VPQAARARGGAANRAGESAPLKRRTTMIEGIIAGLVIHIGQRGIDAFWAALKAKREPIVDQNGHLTYGASGARTTVMQREQHSGDPGVYCRIYGDFHYFTIEDLASQCLLKRVSTELLNENVAPIVLAFEAGRSASILFQANPTSGFDISVPSGVYHFCVFLVDGNAASLVDADRYAVGFRTRVPCANFEGFLFNDRSRVPTLIDDAPLVAAGGEEYSLDFALINIEALPGDSWSFTALSELMNQ
jgi:hypothetical protein